MTWCCACVDTRTHLGDPPDGLCGNFAESRAVCRHRQVQRGAGARVGLGIRCTQCSLLQPGWRSISIVICTAHGSEYACYSGKAADRDGAAGLPAQLRQLLQSLRELGNTVPNVRVKG